MSEPVEKKYKFLLVDDEASILGSFVDAFEDKFQFITANSGREALKKLSENKDIGVVITDQRMPEMTGVDLLRQVKIKYPEKARVLITGYTDLKTAIDAINEGDVFKYIQKPVEEEGTLEILSDALAKYTENLNILQAITEIKRKIKERFIEIYESVASGIAHHVNNGLVPTRTFYDLLPKKMDSFKKGNYDEDFFVGFFNQAVQDLLNVQRIIAMFTWVRNCTVEQFQESKIENLLQLNEADVQEVIKRRKIELEKEIPADLPPVIVDYVKTQEMISLLIKNCAKEAPEGSKIKITAEKGPSSVRIEIARQGLIYKPEEIPRLFDPFYKFDKALKDGISGLDLTNCFIIAAKHGSEIKVKSGPGGTAFGVELPTSR